MVAPPASGLPITGTNDLASMPAPFAAAAAASSFSSFHMEIPSKERAPAPKEESVLREVGRTVERPFEAPAPEPPPKPLHEPFNLNAGRGPPRAPKPTRSADDTADNTADNTVDNTVDNTIDDHSDQTVRLPASPSAAPFVVPPNTLPVPHSRREPAGVKTQPVDGAPQRNFLAGGVLGVVVALLLALLVGGGMLLLRGDDDSGDKAMRARQEALLVDAKRSAEKSDHAWTVAKCTEIIELDGTTRAATEALIVRGRARLALSDREGSDDLREATRRLPVGDALRFQAERALQSSGVDP